MVRRDRPRSVSTSSSSTLGSVTSASSSSHASSGSSSLCSNRCSSSSPSSSSPCLKRSRRVRGIPPQHWQSDHHPFQCDGCGRPLASQAALTRHTKQCSAAQLRTREALSVRKRGGVQRLRQAVFDAIRPRKRPRSPSSTHETGGDASRLHVRPRLEPNSDMEIDDREDIALANDQHSAGDASPSAFFQDSTNTPTLTSTDKLNSPLSPPSPPVPPKRGWKPLRRLLAAFDVLPQGPGQLHTAYDDMPDPSPPTSEQERNPAPSRRVVLHVHENARTQPNRFGVSRVYRRRPTKIPDMNAAPKDLLDTKAPAERERKSRRIKDIVWPYPNVSSFLFNHLHHTGGTTKTLSKRDRSYALMNDRRFHSEDVCGVNFKKMDELIAADAQSPWKGNGWTTTPVTIKIPTGQKMTAARRKQRARERAAAKRHDTVVPPDTNEACYHYHAADVHTRSLMHILKSTVTEEELSKEFHWHPYEEQWTPPYEGFDVESIYGELYGSDAFRQAERELLATPAEPGCDLPRVIAAYMLGSDATQIAQFGQSKAWPLYVFFGNLSMHKRIKPSSHAAHQAAFFPSLPDSINDFLRSKGITPTAPLLTHCRRELFHEVWRILLSDEEFRYAYEHGVVLMCADGIKRRIYPRIFTYSADYPEKVLIATIRDFGACPCTRCLVSKTRIRMIGTVEDHNVRAEGRRMDDLIRRAKVAEARQIIYNEGYAVNSEAVDELLFNESLVPTENAFSAFASRLTRFNFDIFEALVVDIMHEFELGVWKGVLTHLIRMLHSLDRSKILSLNERFRAVPIFGYDTIRYFRANIAELKQLAARDYEDTLQCIIPCIEGLFDDPAHDEFVQKLLYIMAYWHSLAKLKMHTTSTVNMLDRVTTELGKALRYFADIICPVYATRETDREFNARKRAEAKRASSSTSLEGTSSNNTRKVKTFSLATIKLHYLGDAANHVKRYGSLVHISTQPGESEHRVLKRRRLRMGASNLDAQFSKRDVQEWVHRQMYTELDKVYPENSMISEHDDASTDSEDTHSHKASPPPSCSGNTAPTSVTRTRRKPRRRKGDFNEHHHIAENETGDKYYLSRWVPAHEGDPAFKDFIPKLKSHILARFEGTAAASDEPEYSREEWSKIDIEHNRIYPHATATFNFTTYDIRRSQDILHVKHDTRDGKLAKISHAGKCNVMVLSNEDKDVSGRRPSGPFWYARVLGIFHANVFPGPEALEPTRMDFLWVRWFGSEPGWSGGPTALKLDRIGYVCENDPSGSFGFLDPALVVRACHLIPAFAYGKTTSLLGPSVARDDLMGDWESYYVSRFVDRDMMMRYLGLGIGHLNPPDFPHEIHQLASMPDSGGVTDSALLEDDEDEDVLDDTEGADAEYSFE